MKYCENCGQPLSGDEKFCGKCGSPLLPQTTEQTKPTMWENREVPSMGKTIVRTTNKPLMIILSVLMGTAILIGLAFLVEFKPGAVPRYAAQLAKKLTEYTALTEREAFQIGTATVKIVIGMTIFTSYMLSLRATKVIKKAVDLWTRFFVMLAECTVVALPILVYNWYQESFGLTFSEWIKFFSQAHGLERLWILVFIIVTLIFIAIIGGILYFALYILWELFTNNIKINGFVWGILSSVFDMLSSLFVVAAIICVVAFGIALILLPILLCAAMCSDGRRVVLIDGEYYYVD